MYFDVVVCRYFKIANDIQSKILHLTMANNVKIPFFEQFFLFFTEYNNLWPMNQYEKDEF